MDSNNVIQFPVRTEIPRTKEEVDVAVEVFRDEYFDTIAQEVANDLFFRLAHMGFDLLDQDTIKECYLAIEAIKSMMMKSKGLYNPLQDLANVMMHIEGEPYEEMVDNLED